MRASVFSSYSSILKLALQNQKSSKSPSPIKQPKRVKSATLLKQRPSDKLINSSSRDEETTRCLLDSLRIDNDSKHQRQEQTKTIQQYKLQHEKDQCYISHIQQQIVNLEQQLSSVQFKQKKILEPLHNNGSKLLEKINIMEQAKNDYNKELEQLAQCLEVVLEHNKNIQLKYQQKCQEIEKIKSLQNFE